MRGMTAKAAALLAGVMLMAGALQADARGGAKPAPLQFDFDFEATVQADGSVTDVRPDPALPEAIQTLVRQRVATWRYSPTCAGSLIGTGCVDRAGWVWCGQKSEQFCQSGQRMPG